VNVCAVVTEYLANSLSVIMLMWLLFFNLKAKF